MIKSENIRVRGQHMLSTRIFSLDIQWSKKKHTVLVVKFWNEIHIFTTRFKHRFGSSSGHTIQQFKSTISASTTDAWKVDI